MPHRMLRVDLLVAEVPPQHGVTHLVQAHRDLGHQVRVLDLRRVSAVAGRPARVPEPAADIAHSRASALWSLDIQRALAEGGHRVVNTVEGQRAGRDKWLCTRLLIAAGLPVLPTLLAAPGTDAEGICDHLGDDLVLKPLTGHSGHRVIHRLGPAEVSRALSEASQAQVIQPFARDAHCRDQRLIVVGERVVAAYERLAPAGDFRANSSLGGTMTAIRPEPETTSLALRAARACHLDIAGVDILHSPQHGGTLILEVNTNCGIVIGLPTLTGQDIATEMAFHIADLATAS